MFDIIDCIKIREEVRFNLTMAMDKIVNDVFSEASVNRPEDEHMTTGGRQGIHTEHLGHLLSDMQYLQRAYPDAKW